MRPERMKFGIFLAPFHDPRDNPTLAIHRDLQLVELLDDLGYDEAWVGEHHSAGWETIASPEVFIGAAAERTKHIRLGTGVVSLPYHHPLIVADRMVFLDHLTKGRTMFGVGPGALVSDAYMMGIDPPTQRPRMEESLGVIIRLMTEDEPITYKSDWFELNEARLQLRPYTVPHMEMAVAAVQSPAGMVAAGKNGIGVLSFSIPRGGGGLTAVDEFWQIGQKAAQEHGKPFNREDWRVVMHVHLAESRKEAIEQARKQSGRYQREYFEKTVGLPPPPFEGPDDEVIDYMAENKLWCVGTPDDMVARIEELLEGTGGFGGLMIQATEWASREQVFHSYELLARYVMPRFQRSLERLDTSMQWAKEKRGEFEKLRTAAIDTAKASYAAKQSG